MNETPTPTPDSQLKVVYNLLKRFKEAGLTALGVSVSIIHDSVCVTWPTHLKPKYINHTREITRQVMKELGV